MHHQECFIQLQLHNICVKNVQIQDNIQVLMVNV